MMKNLIRKELYRGYQILVSRSGQYRCGYVVIPDNHVLYGKYYNTLNRLGYKIHGGITFSGLEEIDNKKEWIIGFDCGHPGDALDPTLPDDLPEEVKRIQQLLNLQIGLIEGDSGLVNKGVIRTEEFVVDELKKLVDQIISPAMRGS